MAEALKIPKPHTTEHTQSSDSERLNLGLQPALLLVLIGILIALFLLSLSTGSVSIPVDQIVKVLIGGEVEKSSWTGIVLKIRLPRTLTAVLTGSALGVSGLLMQTYFRNVLAGPYVLGISSGASLGVAVVVLSVGSVSGTLMAGLGLSGDLQLAAASAMGSGLMMIVVMLVASRVQNSTTLLILGLMIGYLVSALVSLLLYFALPERIQSYISWTFGSFGGVTWDQMPIMAVGVTGGLLIAATQTKSLNALLLGETYALTLGLNIKLTRLAVLGSTALLAGTVTAFCGPIGFIGVAVPHLCRSLFNTSDHRMLIPGTILMGAVVALIAGIIAQVPGENLVLPLNAITAVIGAPIVILVILHQRNLHRSFGS